MHKYICHFHSWCDVSLSVTLKSAEEKSDAVKGVNEFVSRAGIFSRLGVPGVKIDYAREPLRTPTRRISSMAAMIMFAGENA